MSHPIKAPRFINQRGITDDAYRAWLSEQGKNIWKREGRLDKRGFPDKASLVAALHAAVLRSGGKDAYTGMPIDWRFLRNDWVDANKGNANNRHLMTLRRGMPVFDHVRGLGGNKYALCRRITNHAKSFMSPAQFVQLCREVVRHQDALDAVAANLSRADQR